LAKERKGIKGGKKKWFGQARNSKNHIHKKEEGDTDRGFLKRKRRLTQKGGRVASGNGRVCPSYSKKNRGGSRKTTF